MRVSKSLSLARTFSLRRLLLVGVAAASVTTACAPAVSQAAPGNPADFSVNVFSGWVQRWNPCAPVTYKVDDRMNPGALANVKAAVAQLSRATGITFTYGGTTAFTPSGGNWNQPASLVIAFANNRGVYGGSSYLAGGNQLGEGGFESSYSYVGNPNNITSYKIIKGYAVIDNAGYNRASSKVRMAVLLHELGHAVGLNHAHFSSEIMYPVVSNSGPSGYAAGDLAGLAKVGRAAGCLS
jgi:matrixin